MKNNKAPSPTGVRTELREMIETIGGEGVLLSLLEKFYLRMSEDIIVGFFFDGKDLKKIARLQANFMLAASGLNPNYAGRSPSTAHIALAPILSGHFDRRLVILRELLNEAGLAPSLIERWIQVGCNDLLLYLK